MNKILAFDTSNNSCSVAISYGQNIVAYVEELRPSMQAERLISMIEEVLLEAKLEYRDLDYLALTKGPGSFTGIRIGLAAAKGILLASGIKGLSVTNFEIAYYRARAQIANYDKIYTFINAFKNQLYMQVFDKKSIIVEPALVDFDQAINILNSEDRNIICTGSGLELIYQKVKDNVNVIFLPRFSRIKAIHICRYANDLIAQDKLDNISMQNHSMEPLYIRPPDAKVSQ